MSTRMWNQDDMPIDDVVEVSRAFAAAGIGDIPAQTLAQLVAELDRLRKVEAAARAYVAADPGDIELGEKVWNDLVAVAGPPS